MTASTWAAGSVVERAFTWRGHDRYAHLGLRVAPDEVDFGLLLCDAVCDDPEWPTYREGVVDGLRRAACAEGMFWATVTITELRIHEVDSRRSAFAMAAARCLNTAMAEVIRVARVVPEGVLPRVTKAGRAARGVWEGVSLEVAPLSPRCDARIDWTAQWGDIDPEAQRWMTERVRELREGRAPWVDVEIHTREALRRGHGHTREGLRVAVEAALRAADPAEEDAVLPPVRVRAA
jgi:Elongation factor G, domain IV